MFAEALIAEKRRVTAAQRDLVSRSTVRAPSPSTCTTCERTLKYAIIGLGMDA